MCMKERESERESVCVGCVFINVYVCVCVCVCEREKTNPFFLKSALIIIFFVKFGRILLLIRQIHFPSNHFYFEMRTLMI